MSRIRNGNRYQISYESSIVPNALVKQWTYSEACPLFSLSGRSVCRRAKRSLRKRSCMKSRRICPKGRSILPKGRSILSTRGSSRIPAVWGLWLFGACEGEPRHSGRSADGAGAAGASRRGGHRWRASDGVGLMPSVPRTLLLKATGIDLADDAKLGVGMVFTPPGETRAEAVIESCLKSQELRVLGWRDVPIRPEMLGEIAPHTMPMIRQVLVADDAHRDDVGHRSRWSGGCISRASSLKRAVEAGGGYGLRVFAFDADNCVQVALPGRTYRRFLSGPCDPGVRDELCDLPSTLCDQHAAGVASCTAGRGSWAHNGEINTVWGNRARMAARESTLPVECKPVFTKDGTDSDEPG